MNQLVRMALGFVSRGARGILINNHAQSGGQIRTQIEALAPVFDFIAYDELKERLVSNHWKKPFCLLTFDDGKAINAEQTAPELLRLGVPAVFYLVTGRTGTRHALWFDRRTALQAEGVTVPDPSAFKTISWKEREEKIEKLCQSAGVDADLDDPAVRLMSWDQAAELQANGFELGSHTVDHAILPCETHEEATRQITGSFQHMTDCGLRCRSFAFPNGNLTAALVDEVLAAGFENIVSTVPRWLGSRARLGCLPRLFIKERASVRHVQAKLIASRAGCLLKNPNGEGRRYLFSS